MNEANRSKKVENKKEVILEKLNIEKGFIPDELITAFAEHIVDYGELINKNTTTYLNNAINLYGKEEPVPNTEKLIQIIEESKSIPVFQMALVKVHENSQLDTHHKIFSSSFNNIAFMHNDFRYLKVSIKFITDLNAEFDEEERDLTLTKGKFVTPVDFNTFIIVMIVDGRYYPIDITKPDNTDDIIKANTVINSFEQTYGNF